MLLLVLVVSLAACSQPSLPAATPSATADVRAAAENCKAETRSAISAFFRLFNSRQIDSLASRFADDANLNFTGRGEAVQFGWMADNRAAVEQLLRLRADAQETLVFSEADILLPYDGTLGGSVSNLKGLFPDGFSRRLDAKFGYDCDRRQFTQVLITTLGRT